jgi:hypothetical protein
VSSALWEIENSLLLRSALANDDATSIIRYVALHEFAAETFKEEVDPTQLAHSVARLSAALSLPEDTAPDSEVGNILGTLDPIIDIPRVASNVKYIFDTVAGVESAVTVTIANENDVFVFALATAIATSSVITVAARIHEAEPDALADSLLEKYRFIPPKPPLFEYHEENFFPYSYTFDVERVIRLNSEFDDHNIEALRHKSFTGTKDNNLPFSDMSRSLAAFVWAINRTIDLHRDDTFVYDFNRIGTEHIARIARSWGIKDIDELEGTVESIMKGIGTIYDTDEKLYSYPVPNVESDEYDKFRYTFNVATAAIASAHVYLFASNFDSTQDGVYGEVRRTIKEVQSDSAESA